MRRSVLSAILAASLSLVACSDQPTELPSQPEVAPSTAAPLNAASCTLADILRLTSSLFPPGPVRTAILALANRLPTTLPQRQTIAARRLMFQIVDGLLKAFYAGKLYGGTSDATKNNVLALINALYCYVGLPQPTIPVGALGPNGVVKILTNSSPTTDITTPNRDGTVRVPQGAVPLSVPATAISISPINPLPNESGPLLTSLNQFPPFFEFSSSPEVTFTFAVTTGICVNTGVASTGPLQLAHNVEPFTFGSVDVLPFAAPFDLTCLSPLRLGSKLGSWGRFAWAKVLLPSELHAATAAVDILGVGGTTKKFSPFGGVEPGSNPGILSIVNPAGGNVGEPGMVSVKATSKNEGPIQKVPVTFHEITGGTTVETIVETGANGIASYLWDAEPGTTLTATVPNENNEGHPTCPSDIPAHAAADPYRPLVCFTPSLVTFTAPSPLILTFGGGNGQAGFTNQILTDPVQVFASNGAEPVEGVVIHFTVAEGSIPASATTNADGLVEVLWTLGPTVGSQTGTVSADGADHLNLSATATAPPLVRAVLDWGETPLDLDFHLTGPGPTGSRFHVYYFTPCYPGPDTGGLTGCQAVDQDATLDRDDQISFGPETITINRMVNGTYRFSVHNYSNRAATSSDALSLSGAKVTVYIGSGTPQVLNVPAEAGTLWTVFELSGATITLVNNMGDESNPSDITAFSVFGRVAGFVQSDAAVIRDATEGHPK